MSVEESAHGRPGWGRGALLVACVMILGLGGWGSTAAAHEQDAWVSGPLVANCTNGAALLVEPASGSPPLIVSFTFAVPGGNASTLYSWNFGDGAFWNGSGAGYADPTHLYSASGAYSVLAEGRIGSVVDSCATVVQVGPQRLVAGIEASPSGGNAPLSVHFEAKVGGGSGTYTGFRWAFGDGAVALGLSTNHTFTNAGVYNVSLNVTDSSGTTVGANIVLNVAAPGSVSIPQWLAPIAPAIPWMLAGLVGALAVILVVLVGRLRLARARLARDIAAWPPSSSVRETRSPSNSLPSTASLADESPAENSPVPRSTSAAPKDLVQLSQRIVHHLAAQGPLRPDEVGALGFTQAGLQEALGVSRSSVSNALRRLEVAGILRHDVRHVRGVDRRVRVYTLTDRGSSLAQDLRRRGRGFP